MSELERVDNYEIISVDSDAIQIEAVERANIDVQVATAKKYPRNIKKCMDNMLVMATIDEDTAKSCSYALPRGGKPIVGPSVHLAKIVTANWGHMRTNTNVVSITDKQVVCRGIAWDLESNVASCVEVRRSIVGKNGRFTDDMINVICNAANSIAYRNAVFNVVPKAVTDKVYKAAQQLITGDLSDETKLIKKRKQIIDGFADNYGIKEEDLLKIIGLNTANQIKADQISTLIGIVQALKDGDTTVNDLLSSIQTRAEKGAKFVDEK